MNAKAVSAFPGTRRVFHASQPRSASFAADDGRLRLVFDPLRVLLVALTIVTISRVHQHYSLLMKLRPALLLAIGSVAYAYLKPRALTRSNVLGYWPMRNVALLGILACCSAVFGLSLGRTASFILSSYIKVLAYSFLLAVSIRHVRDLYTYVWAYVVSCGILSFFSLFVFGITRSNNSDFARLSNLYTFDANDICVIMMLGLPMALLLLVSNRYSWPRRAILLAIVVGMSATIARSGSRGGFLGLATLALSALILVNSVSVSRRTGMLTAVVIALLLGATPGYWKQMGTVLRPKDDYNYATLYGRKALAERGIGYMKRYPVFGVGMNNFPRAECTISPLIDSLGTNAPVRCRAPHNSYVEAGSELGVPGLLTWVSLELGVIVSMLRLRRRLPRAWRRGTETERFLYGATSFLPLAMIGFAVTAFFVSFAWLDPIYLLAAFTTGVYIAVREHVNASQRAPAVAASPAVSRATSGWRVLQSAQKLGLSQARAAGQ
ncbi:MAG TPA: O-antigen ligase family protein [Gemmatimonadaceae bacterium]|nr:O-antigen ligase family protein [Gemmatimonadaceae bacterium]